MLKKSYHRHTVRRTREHERRMRRLRTPMALRRLPATSPGLTPPASPPAVATCCRHLLSPPAVATCGHHMLAIWREVTIVAAGEAIIPGKSRSRASVSVRALAIRSSRASSQACGPNASK